MNSLSPREEGANEEKVGAVYLNPEEIRNRDLILSHHLFYKTWFQPYNSPHP
jgi:hypothetical protein